MNKSLVRRFVGELLNRRDWRVADEILADDFKFYFAGTSAPLDRRGFQSTLDAFHQGFPDISFAIDDLIGEDDRVAARFTMAGTHAGAFEGLAATGKHAVWGGIAIFRIADGKIAEEWPFPDVLGLLRQLGVVLK